MMGPTTLKEIRAQLCERLDIEDDELDRWMSSRVARQNSSPQASDAKLQSLLQELENAVKKKRQKPRQAGRKRATRA
jgi:hypothetical protein